MPGETNANRDVFVHDRKTHKTVRALVDSNGNQSSQGGAYPAISANGRWVAFVSDATNLVRISILNLAQVYLRDARTGETVRISGSTVDVEGDAGADAPCLTPDGRFVAYTSLAANLDSGDTNAAYDVYVYDVRKRTNVRASVDSAGAAANDHNDLPSISTDGRFVAFTSHATNLVPGDGNGASDIFLRALR